MLMYISSEKCVKDNEDRLVFYVDDLNEQVVEEVVDLWNKNKEIKVIQGHLDKSVLCTSEETEYLMEQIGNYEKGVASTTEGDKIAENIKIGMDTLTPHEVAETLTAIVNSAPVIREVPSTNIAAILPGFATEPGTPAPLEKKGRKQAPAVRTGGKVDAKDLIASMREKIALIEWIDEAILDMNLPEALNKGAREILIALQRDVEKAKETAVQNIQNL